MRKEKIIVADRYMTLKSVKPKKDCNVCDYINDYVCFDHEHQQIKKVYPNAIYNDDCDGLFMNKQLTQKQNLDELMKQTLLNILSAKGIIYTYYKNNKLTKGKI
jgi:hypothetical protein